MKLNNLSALFLIFISVLLSFVVRTHAYKTIHYNKLDGEYISPIGGYFAFPDGSVLLRFYRPLKECNEAKLNLKLLYTNGTLLPFNVRDFSPPEFNFCRLNALDIRSPDYIQITNLRMVSSNFYILYYNISDNPSARFGRVLLELDMGGNKIK